jgi:hypothetical protein
MAERRVEPRYVTAAAATLWWEERGGGAQARAQVVDFSEGGLRVRSRVSLPRDCVVWCAVPSLGIYARTLVCHTRGLFTKTSGLRRLADPLGSN